MGLWDSISGFVSDNSSWLEPAAKAGLGAYQIYNQNQANNANLDYMKQNEDANYQAYLANREYLQNQMDSSSSGSGGGSSGAAKIAALQKALDAYTAKMAEAKALTTPYYNAGIALLPQAQANASGAMTGIKKLQDYMLTDDYLASTNQSKPAYSIATPIPSYLRGK